MEGDLTTKLHRKQNERILNGEPKQKTTLIRKKEQRKFEWGRGLLQPIDNTGQFIRKTGDLPSCCTNPAEEQSEIQEFFHGSDVLITGVTGFLGKILLEKLLVSCPNIGNIYVIIREKKGKSFKERFELLFKEDVFKRLHKLVPNFVEKVIAVKGDCSNPRLGLSNEDYKLLIDRISIIFHGAATVRFDETLQLAANINVRGVWEMIKLAKECKFLKSMMHVSTAYSNCTSTNEDITESFYPPAYDYRRILDLVDNESEEVLKKITKSLINPWPNTYSFTKQIGEEVVRKEGHGLPIGILRPAIVIATYKEPIRGWSDNIYGPTGVIVGAGTGLLRVCQCDPDKVANMVPVDMTVNALIAASYTVSENFKQGEKSINIFNYVSSPRNSTTWGEFTYWNGAYGHNWPTTFAIWYSCFNQIKNKFLFVIANFLLHTIPAYLIDGALIICRKKPRMTKLYEKIRKFNEVISYFATKSWNFTDDNVVKLWNGTSPKDRAIYPFDIADLDWDYFTQAHLLGLRVYLVKDDIDSLPKARRKWNRLYVLHRSVQALLALLLSWFAMVLFRLFSN